MSELGIKLWELEQKLSAQLADVTRMRIELPWYESQGEKAKGKIEQIKKAVRQLESEGQGEIYP